MPFLPKTGPIGGNSSVRSTTISVDIHTETVYALPMRFPITGRRRSTMDFLPTEQQRNGEGKRSRRISNAQTNSLLQGISQGILEKVGRRTMDFLPRGATAERGGGAAPSGASHHLPHASRGGRKRSRGISNVQTNFPAPGNFAGNFVKCWIVWCEGRWTRM